MTEMSLAGSPIVTPARSRLVQVGLAVAGGVSVASSFLAAATIYLVFIQPAVVAQALVGHRPEMLVGAFVSLVLRTLLSLLGAS